MVEDSSIRGVWFDMDNAFCPPSYTSIWSCPDDLPLVNMVVLWNWANTMELCPCSE